MGNDNAQKKAISIEKYTQLRQMKCEMCGGTELVKRDGVFICEHCKTKYSIDEAKKLMIEGDGDIVITGKVEIDNKEKISNLYTLAQRAHAQQNYTDALKYYEMLLIEDPNNWIPIFYTNYLKFFCLKVDLEHLVQMSQEIALFRKNITEAVKQIINSKNSQENEKVLSDIFEKTLNLCNQCKIKNDDLFNLLSSKQKENYIEKYERNVENIALLYELLGDYFEEYLRNQTKFMICWEKAYEYAKKEYLKKRIIAKIQKYNPSYKESKVNEPFTGVKVLKILFVLFVLFIISLIINSLGIKGLEQFVISIIAVSIIIVFWVKLKK